MQTFISILRGINVSGQKQIKMTDLKALYEKLGFENVRTYIQSGNVLFESVEQDTTILMKKIEQAITEKYAFEVPVLILTTTELDEIIRANPFLEENDIETDKLHITFLAEIPEQAVLEKFTAPLSGNDRGIISGKAIYLYCPDGYGRTKLTNTFFEAKLKIRATTRNWKTANELLKLAILKP